MPGQQPYQQLDMSGGLQTATSRFLRKKNEVIYSRNASFNVKIGSATRRFGYEQVGRTLQDSNDGLGLHIYKYGANNKVVAGINNAAGTNATLQFLDVAGYWNPFLTTAAPNTRFSMVDYLEELYVAGFSRETNTYLPLTHIDQTLASNSANIFAAPNCRFITEFQGSLYAIGCQVGGTRYKDRAYRSSPALGAITFVQGNQTGLLNQLSVDSVQYLKAGMVIDIYSAGTNSLVNQAITIVSVNKAHHYITFAPTQIKLSDNDEIWASGRKGQLSIFWNTDSPTPETSDFIRIPTGMEEDPTITAFGKTNSRLLFFTRNTAWKWDGQNLINISYNVGCVASESVQNIGSWTIWLHYTGVWGYNDITGQLQLLSRPINNYIAAINQVNIHKASAIVSGRVYKLSIGEIGDLDASTTSTSTSSTSTSSTSSSTSSTSTSSTSTSSTSQSTSTTTVTTTSTSTSSTSTSSTSQSTSTSSTSTSQSTSSTSTSTTTLSPGKQVIRLVYDFDSNSWWAESHRREIRYQVMHTMNGYTKPYFLDDTGRFFRDETGNLDHMDTIPFEVQMGRNNQGNPLTKKYIGTVIQTEKARGALVQTSVDGETWKDVGQVNQDVQVLKFKEGRLGHDIDFKIEHNDAGDGPSFDGITTYYTQEESTLG